MVAAEAFMEIQEEATGWRRYLHQHPELDYNLHNTAKFVADTLASFNVDQIHTGIAETGIVAIIHGKGGIGPTVGLRADMDALPIHEETNLPWVSQNQGKMHACGHDGHTAMLLGAAKCLSQRRSFKGSVALIFQPAEEGALGGQKMVEEGIMERFGISHVFGMHNKPGMDIGRFGICRGPYMAALDEFDIVVHGKGGHAASPHLNIDPIVIAAQIVMGLQTLVSRSTDPLDSLVLSVTRLVADGAYNIIPERAEIGGTVRTLIPGLRDFAETRIPACARAIASGYGADITFKYRRHDPVSINAPAETEFAIKAATELVGAARCDTTIRPTMGSEDFAYMLEARPGAYILLGNGPTPSLHHPAYDFNDEALPYGIGFWVNLVEAVSAAT